MPCNVATLAVEAVSDADNQTFDAQRSWSGFANHSVFDQRIERFVNLVDVNLSALKAWRGTHVDLTAPRITGTAGGCPWWLWYAARPGRPAGVTPLPPQPIWVALEPVTRADRPLIWIAPQSRDTRRFTASLTLDPVAYLVRADFASYEGADTVAGQPHLRECAFSRELEIEAAP